MTQPIIAPPLPLFTRLILAVRCWTFKSFVYLALNAMYHIKAKEFAKHAPTYSKVYSCRPMLKNRVFLPASYKPGSQIPLFIDIHGGGFALCDPQVDDEFCHQLANKYNLCVVSINYRKAPLHPFPTLISDAEAIAKAVIADPDLPVDHSKIAMGGFSAGGNLSLAIAQLDGIREKVKAIVPIYPVVDFSGTYKGQARADQWGVPDRLEKMAPIFNWAYISKGEDRVNPLMSPIFATRKDLPQKIFFIGAEYDYLCYEAGEMAKKLAGLKKGADAWSETGIKWMKVPGVRHGFTHVRLKGQAEIERANAVADTYAAIGKWLQVEAFV
jgi:acetyl esterase/lipase